MISSTSLLVLQILTVQICNIRRNEYMKATGIVRRIETRVIITQKSLKAL